MKASELRKLIREEVKAIVKEQHLHEKAEYFPAGLSKHLQRALLAALKDGTIRITGKDRQADATDFPGYAEDMALDLIRGKSLKDIIKNM